MDLFILIGILATFTGFLSGLLGIGGGILMAPLLLYVPDLFDFTPMNMQTVAGLTIVQGLVACISGGLTHKKFHFLSGKLVAWMGISLFISSFIGGICTGFISNTVLLSIFAVIAVIAAILIIQPKVQESEYPEISQLTFSRVRAVAVSTVVGFFGGLVGQGGSFILIPLMTSYMGVPTRIAIGSNLAIVFLSTFAAFSGKALTSQIEWSLALPIVLAVLPGAYLGAFVSRKVSVGDLRILLAVCIALAALRIGFSALGY